MNEQNSRSVVPGSSDPDREAPSGLTAYPVIQQQLIDARDRLDREVVRLTRLHAFNARALAGVMPDEEFVAAVAEAVVDVFELEFGICWLLTESGQLAEPLGVLGIPRDERHLRESGERLADFLLSAGGGVRVIGSNDLERIATCMPIPEAICACCLDGEGRRVAMILGGNTRAGADFYGAVSPERVPVFGLFAQQLGALLQNRRGRAIIERQMAEIRRADEALRVTLENNRAGLWDMDLETGKVTLSLGWTSFGGEEARGRVVDVAMWLAALPDEDRRPLEENLETIRAGGRTSFELVHRLRLRDGSSIWVLTRGKVVQESGEPSRRLVGTTFDFSRQKKLETDLEKERAFLRTLIRTLPDLVWLKDPEGVYLACNPRFELFLGAPEAEIVGRSDYDFLTKEQVESFRRHDRAALEAGAPLVNEEEVVYASDGHREFLETIKTPMYGHDGQLIGVLGVARDITRRRAAEEQVRKLSRAVEQSPSSIVITDLGARIEFVNDAFVRATGYSREEVLGRNPRILHSGETPQATYRDLWDTLTDGRIWQGEFHNKRKDGSLYLESAILAPIRQPDGRITHYLAIKEDITEERRIALELEEHRHRLMDLVSERTRELAQAKDAAEAANRAKSTFLANMSHEIRTPMNAIIGLTHLLQREALTAAQLARLQKVSESANHLLGILNDILDISKIESDKLILEQAVFTPDALVANVIAVMGERFHAKGLAFSVDVADLPARLVGDPMRVSQILVNYLANAVKFTETGRIALRGKLLDQREHSVLVRFEVEDTGIGIGAEARDRIFQSFEQADNSITRSFGGTGLGLAICKRLARLMGGEVGVDSTPGQGSTFWATLRLGEAGAGASASEPASFDPEDPLPEEILRRDFGHCRILLAEDNLVNREVALELLRDEAGLPTDVAKDGEEALRLAASLHYDLILMDVQMPVMDGLAAAAAIRRLPGYEITPILAMTANAFDEDRQACLAAGMNEHVGKPVDPSELFRVLRFWLEQGRPPAP